MEDQLTSYLAMTLAGLLVLVPVSGLIWLGARRERRLMQSLIREHLARLERLSVIRGGRR